MTEEQLRDGAFAGAVALDTALTILRERDTALDEVARLGHATRGRTQKRAVAVDSQRSLINTIDDLKQKEAQ